MKHPHVFASLPQDSMWCCSKLNYSSLYGGLDGSLIIKNLPKLIAYDKIFA